MQLAGVPLNDLGPVRGNGHLCAWSCCLVLLVVMVDVALIQCPFLLQYICFHAPMHLYLLSDMEKSDFSSIPTRKYKTI